MRAELCLIGAALLALASLGMTAQAQPTQASEASAPRLENLLPASVSVPASRWLSWQMTQWYPARAADFTQAAEALHQALSEHCQGESVVPSRQAWRDVLTSWARLSALSAPPLMAGDYHPPIETSPAQAEALEAAISAAARTTALPNVDLLLPSARGLGALEWLLWTPPVATLKPQATPSPRANAAVRSAKASNPRAGSASTARKPAAPARRAGARVALPERGPASLASTAREAVAAAAPRPLSVPPHGWRQWLSGWRDAWIFFAKPEAKPSKPAAKPAASVRKRAAPVSRRPFLPTGMPLRASRTADPSACRLAQALSADVLRTARHLQARFDPQADPLDNALPAPDVLARWQAGLVEVEAQTRRLAEEEPEGRARLRPHATWVLSGSGPTERAARWSALRDLAVGESQARPRDDSTADSRSLEAWLRGRGQAQTAERLHLTVRAVDRAVQGAALDTATELQQAARALGVLRQLVASEVAPALGLVAPQAASAPSAALRPVPVAASAGVSSGL